YTVLSQDKKSNTMILEITLREGKNRHIRRMMEQLGFPVLKLKREKYGMLTLGELKLGNYRPLTPHEVKQMRHLATNNVEKKSKLVLYINGTMCKGVVYMSLEEVKKRKKSKRKKRLIFRTAILGVMIAAVVFALISNFNKDKTI